MRLSVQYYMVIFFKFKSSKNNYGFIDEKKNPMFLEPLILLQK